MSIQVHPGRRISAGLLLYGIPSAQLMDFLPRYFANVDFYHWQAFDRSLLEENPPDAVIYLIVERDLTRIPQDVGKMVPEE